MYVHEYIFGVVASEDDFFFAHSPVECILFNEIVYIVHLYLQFLWSSISI